MVTTSYQAAAMEACLSLCIIAISTLLVLCFCKVSSLGGNKQHLPPGPWTLPIIGSLHHLIISHLAPHRRMMVMSRRHGPLMHLSLGEVPTVVVSSAEAASLVMKTHDVAFASRPHSTTQDIVGCGGKGIVLAPYGEHWRQMRKICIVELLSSKQVRRMEGIRFKEVGNLLRSIIAATGAAATINLSDMVAALSNNVVTCAVFGGKFTQQEEYLRELDMVNDLNGGFSLVDLFPSSPRMVRWFSNGELHTRRCYARIQRIIADVIEGRKAANRLGFNTDSEDLLNVLLSLQEHSSLAIPLTTESMGAVIFDIFGAATDTTATTLVWAMSELLSNPKAMSKAKLEVRDVVGKDRAIVTSTDVSKLPYMGMVIKEALRLHPPAPFLIPREAREDCEIMGYNIPKGTNIFVNVFAISRDPKHWDNPERFMPERFEHNKVEYYGTNFEFTPFGAGRRQCPGILFGTSTVEIALANLLYHFDWALPDGSSTELLDMSERFGITVRRKYDLELIATAYPHSKATSI